MKKHLLKALGLSLAALALPSSFEIHAAAPMFHESAVITSKSIQLYGFNNAGDVLALLELEEGDGFRQQSVVIRGSSIMALTEVPNANVQIAQANAISQRRANGHVYVAGVAHMRDGFRRAAVWDLAPDGTYTFTTAKNIVLPEGSAAPGEQGASEGFAINQAGVMAGSAASFLASIATRWVPPYAQAEVLPLSTSSAFIDINEDGDMLADGVQFGGGTASERFSAAIVKSNGDLIEVPRLDANAMDFPNTAKMRRGDWVVGEARLGNTARGYAWKVGSNMATNLPSPAFKPDAQAMQAFSINASGEALGWINGGDFTQELILWKPGNGGFVPYRFVDLIPGQTFTDGRVDAALNNDSGQVATLKIDRLFKTTSLRVYDPVAVGVVQLLTPWVSALEESGKIEFKVSLTRVEGVAIPVSVQVRTEDESATAPLDYTAINQTVTWGPLEAGEKTISVTLKDNLENAAERQFRLLMGAVTGGVLTGPTEAAGAINDSPQEIVIRNASPDFFGNTSVEVMEGSAQVTIEFERVGGSDGAIEINQFTSTDFTAHVGVDFAAPSGGLAWEPGEKGVKVLNVPLLNAGPLEAGRVFAVTGEASLSNAGSWQVSRNITILPVGQPTPPLFMSSKLGSGATKLTVNVRAAQGGTVQLQKKSSLGGEWITDGEAVSAAGFVTFEAPVAAGSGQLFLRARTKP
jgi:hypothetical protein